MPFDVDLFVIGGGSGGVRAARMAADTGAKVALAEESRMGGTCVIRGCVPKKMMVFASQFHETLDLAPAYGWQVTRGGFDWTPFRARMHAELDRLEGIYRRMLAGAGVQVHDTRATVTDPHTVRLATGQTVTAAHILIATGGHPLRPAIAGAEVGLLSDDIFLMEELPRSILIVGGGYIACEMACILNGMGVKVTQIYRGAQILRGFDDEARGLVAESIRACGVDLHVGTDIARIAAPGTQFEGPTDGMMERSAVAMPQGRAAAVQLTSGRSGTWDAILFATGRAPNARGIGLDDLGVGFTRRGHIVVNAYSQTAVPSIYALGDVTDRPQLTPVAIRDAMSFVATVFHGRPTPVDHDLIASAVFTQPELGHIGLTEEQAREQEAIEVYATTFRPMRSAFADRPDRVLMKLIVSQATRRVLGCHIVAPDAGEMIQLVAIAIRMGATKEDFDRTVAVHPTMAEELVTMRKPVRQA
jgi:glutathione reductase (NADPH)